MIQVSTVVADDMSACPASTGRERVKICPPPSTSAMSKLAPGPTSVAAGRGETSVVFQAPTLTPWASALANVALPLELAGIGTAEARRRAAVDRHAVERFAAERQRDCAFDQKIHAVVSRKEAALLPLDEYRLAGLDIFDLAARRKKHFGCRRIVDRAGGRLREVQIFHESFAEDVRNLNEA